MGPDDQIARAKTPAAGIEPGNEITIYWVTPVIPIP